MRHIIRIVLLLLVNCLIRRKYVEIILLHKVFHRRKKNIFTKLKSSEPIIHFKSIVCSIDSKSILNQTEFHSTSLRHARLTHIFRNQYKLQKNNSTRI